MGDGLAVHTGAAAVCTNAELENLLHRVYVGGGFTDADVAKTLLRAPAVRARGELLTARAAAGPLAGMVMLVSEEPVRRLAAEGECEMHLLAVDPAYRSRGVGKALVAAALRLASSHAFRRMVLWTQPAMTEAQRLYASAGFLRVPARDFSVRGRDFLVFERAIE